MSEPVFPTIFQPLFRQLDQIAKFRETDDKNQLKYIPYTSGDELLAEDKKTHEEASWFFKKTLSVDHGVLQKQKVNLEEQLFAIGKLRDKVRSAKYGLEQLRKDFAQKQDPEKYQDMNNEFVAIWKVFDKWLNLQQTNPSENTLRQENQSLNSQLKSQTEQRSAIEATYKDLQAVHDKCSQTDSLLKNRIEKLQSELEVAQNNLQKLDTEKEKLQSELKVAQNNLQNINTEKERLKKGLTQVNLEIMKLQNEEKEKTQTSGQKIRELESKLSTKENENEKEIERLNKEIEKLKKENTQINTDQSSKNLQQQIQQLERDKASLTNNIETMKKDLENLKENVTKLEQEKKALEQEKKNIQEQMKKTKDRVKTIEEEKENDLAASMKVVREKEGQIDSLTLEKGRLDKRISDLEGRIKNLDAKKSEGETIANSALEEARKQIDQLKAEGAQEKKKLEEELNKLKSQKSQNETQFKTLKDQLENKGNSIDKLDTELKNQMQANSRLLAKNKEQESQITDLKQQLTETASSLKKMPNRVARLFGISRDKKESVIPEGQGRKLTIDEIKESGNQLLQKMFESGFLVSRTLGRKAGEEYVQTLTQLQEISSTKEKKHHKNAEDNQIKGSSQRQTVQEIHGIDDKAARQIAKGAQTGLIGKEQRGEAAPVKSIQDKDSDKEIEKDSEVKGIDTSGSDHRGRITRERWVAKRNGNAQEPKDSNNSPAHTMTGRGV